MPRCSMYGIFTYIWAIIGVNVGKYSIHGASGMVCVSYEIVAHLWHLGMCSNLELEGPHVAALVTNCDPLCDVRTRGWTLTLAVLPAIRKSGLCFQWSFQFFQFFQLSFQLSLQLCFQCFPIIFPILGWMVIAMFYFPFQQVGYFLPHCILICSGKVWRYTGQFRGEKVPNYMLVVTMIHTSKCI